MKNVFAIIMLTVVSFSAYSNPMKDGWVVGRDSDEISAPHASITGSYGTEITLICNNKEEGLDIGVRFPKGVTNDVGDVYLIDPLEGPDTKHPAVGIFGLDMIPQDSVVEFFIDMTDGFVISYFSKETSENMENLIANNRLSNHDILFTEFFIVKNQESLKSVLRECRNNVPGKFF